MQELKRCVKELGFPGVEIGSHINDWNLDAPELQSLFAVSEKYFITTILVCWATTGSRGTWCVHFRPPVGHGAGRQDVKVLVAMAGRHAQ